MAKSTNSGSFPLRPFPAFEELNGVEQAVPAGPDAPALALDAAMALPAGLGVIWTLPSTQEARLWRWRLYSRRWRAKRAATHLPREDAAFGKTPWDPLVVVVSGRQVWGGRKPQPVSEPDRL